MATLRNAFQTWNLQNLQELREKGHKTLQLNAALSAEERVADIMKQAGCKCVHLRKRIYVMQDGHHREIDIVALTDRIICIEVKNWAGRIWKNKENRWFQLPPYQTKALEFGDIYEEANHKAIGLRKHLENDHKIQLPENCVIPIVVFTRDTCKLDPATLGLMKGVFTMDSFTEYIKTVCAETWGQWLWSFVPYFGHQGQLTAELRTRVSLALSQVKTWDIVLLHNGTMIHGDLKAVECPNVNIGYERHHITDMTITWASTGVMGLLTSFYAGSAASVFIALTDKKKVPKKKEVGKPRDADGNMRFPVTMDKRDQACNDRLVFKRAGSPHTELISLAQIRSIQLSPTILQS